MWPPYPNVRIVIRASVAMLDDRRRGNRRSRRRKVYGKLTHDQEMAGRLSPKEVREWK